MILASDFEVTPLHHLMTLDNPEKAMLSLPQVSCPVTHYFGPGICIREVSMAAGTLAIGHRQKFEHMNIMLKGKVLMIGDDGKEKILVAPLLFVGKPGRKVGYVLEDVVWQNVYATDLKTADEVESFFIEKSEDWKQDNAAKFAHDHLSKEADRQDYARVVEECGIPADIIEQQVMNTDDVIAAERGIVRVADSPIHGKGLFVTTSVKAGETIVPARVNGNRTQAGRYTNHSTIPNAMMQMLPNGDIALVATEDIQGCAGGSVGTEVTICYRQALTLSGVICYKEQKCLV